MGRDHSRPGAGGRLAAAAVAGFALLADAGCGRAPAVDDRAAAAAAPATPTPPGLDYIPPAPGSYRLPPIQPAVDGAVLTAGGERRRLFDYFGDRLVLLSFIYTRCKDGLGCPMANEVFHRLHRRLVEEDDLAGRVRLVTLSFDPDRDTPRVMRSLAGGLDPGGRGDDDWAFLTTASAADLQPILDGYGQYIVPERDATGRFTGDFSHVLKVFLIDRRLRVRNIYSTSFLHPALVINDLETLMLEREETG